jgi:hypothetical protein
MMTTVTRITGRPKQRWARVAILRVPGRPGRVWRTAGG